MMDLDRHNIQTTEIYKQYGINLTYKASELLGRYKQAMQRTGKYLLKGI
jgi:hypothetical protein